MIEALREKALALPMKPGVYIMTDAAGKVIYVGKAKLLKNRVSSYFHGDHDQKTETMVSKVADFDVIIANSEFEALVLENYLIKHHMPKYNILLKDGKGYPIVRIDIRIDYPVFELVSEIKNDGAKYLGPFGARHATYEAIEAVLKALKLPTCGKTFPRDIGKGRPCLNYHMKSCLAYCRPEADKAQYKEAMNAAAAIFEGKAKELVKKLEREMEEAAENLRFEIAADRRDKLRAVSALQKKQLIVDMSFADTDVIGYYRGAAKTCFTALHYIGGKLLGKDCELFDTPLEDDEDALSGVIRQYYSRKRTYPKNIFLPIKLDDAELLEKMFSDEAGCRVFVKTPERGDKAKLIETANINAREEAERASTREEKTLKTLEWLGKALGMDSAPERIEAYDISNTGSSEIVASMTVFVKGRPLKKDYRRFKIKTLEEPDDYASMAEVLTRRIERYKTGDDKFAELPDIMFIDGGANHAKVARAVLNREGVEIAVFGMVKDDRHRTRGLISPDGDELGLSGNPAAFALVGTIQEETHRFAIEYHRKLRSKNSFSSVLENIDGVGATRREQLLKSFKSVRAIKAATEEELAKVVPKNTAKSIYSYFNEKSGE